MRKKRKGLTIIYLPKDKPHELLHCGYRLLIIGPEPNRIAVKYSGRIKIATVPRPDLRA